MIPLRQSTASQEVLLGPFVDSTDGNTAETGLTIANSDIKLHKAGGTTLANKNSGGATHISAGNYYAVLDATDTDTVGSLTIIVQVAGALAFRCTACVFEEAVFDALYAASAAGYPNAAGIRAAVGLATANLDTQLSGIQSDTNDLQTRLPAALVSGRMDASVGAMAANVMTAAAAAADLTTELQAGLATAATLATVAGYLDTEIAAILAAVDTEVAAIKAKTDALPTDPADASDIAGAFATVNATLATILGLIDTEIAAIKAKTDNLPTDPADESNTQTALTALTGIANAIKAVSDKLDTSVELDGAVYRFTTNALENAPAGGGGGSGDWTAGEKEQIRNRLGLDGDASAPVTAKPNLLEEVVEGTVTAKQSLRLANAVLAGKVSGAGTGTEVFRDLADTKSRISATVDAEGNRSVVVRDVS